MICKVTPWSFPKPLQVYLIRYACVYGMNYCYGLACLANVLVLGPHLYVVLFLKKKSARKRWKSAHFTILATCANRVLVIYLNLTWFFAFFRSAPRRAPKTITVMNKPKNIMAGIIFLLQKLFLWLPWNPELGSAEFSGSSWSRRCVCSIMITLSKATKTASNLN